MGFGRGRGRGRGGDECCGMSGCMCAAVSSGCVMLIILIAVLIGVSIKTLETNEVGLDYDGFNMKINDKLYEGGTYFLGLAHHFETYPKTQQTLKFQSPVLMSGILGTGVASGAEGPAVPCRSSDGLPVAINCAFNYRLMLTVESIQLLYINYGSMPDIEMLYQRIARNVVRTVASRYEAATFFTDARSAITSDMQIQLNADMSQFGAIVESFQLLDVGVTADFNDVRSRQQAALQEVQRAQADLNVVQINAYSRVQAAKQTATLIISQAQNNAQQAELSNDAAIAAFTARYVAERVSYASLKAALNMTSEELLGLVWLDAQTDGFASNKVKPVMRLPASVEAELAF